MLLFYFGYVWGFSLKMDFKVEINRLSQDEGEYELGIRGITDFGTVDEIRRMLRRLMRMV